MKCTLYTCYKKKRRCCCVRITIFERRYYIIILNFAYVLLYTFGSTLDIFREVPFLFLEISINIVPHPIWRLSLSVEVYYTCFEKKKKRMCGCGRITCFAHSNHFKLCLCTTLYFRKHSRHFQRGTILISWDINQYSTPPL